MSTARLPPFLATLNPSIIGTSLLPIEAKHTHSEKLGHAPAHCLWWPNKNEAKRPDSVLLFVTGNPGLSEFYTEYLNRIHESTTIDSMAILARSLIGHSPKVDVVGRRHTGLNIQVEAVLEALNCISDTFGHDTEVFLVGHSIGSWIILQATKQRRELVSCVILLCPTIAHMASTPNGKRLSWLFATPFPNILATLSHLLKVTPKALIYTFFRVQWPRYQFNVLWNFINSPSAIISSLTLAHEEILTVKELDKALLDEVKHISYWFFGGEDGWVGDNEDAIIKQVMDESLPDRIFRDTTVPHSFPINHAEKVALVTLDCLEHHKRTTFATKSA